MEIKRNENVSIKELFEKLKYYGNSPMRVLYEKWLLSRFLKLQEDLLIANMLIVDQDGKIKKLKKENEIIKGSCNV